MESFFWDLRYACRTLVRSKLFAGAAILTVALGLGANAAIFSIVDVVLVRPLPYPESDRLVAIWSRFLPVSGFDFSKFSVDPSEYVDYRDNNRSMQSVAAYTFASSTVSGDGQNAELATAILGSWNLLPILKTPPQIGRLFTPQDDLPDAPLRVILSHGFWQRRYGGDTEIVGKTVTMSRQNAEVIGVMPEGFSFPVHDVAFWAALNLDEGDLGNRKSHYLRLIGRLAPEASLESAQAEMTQMMATWKEEYPDIHTGHFLFLLPLYEEATGTVRPALLTLMGTVGCIMLVVCANVANLLLVRSQQRSHETALIKALGAGQRRIFQQSLALCLIIVGTGALLGLVFAYGGLSSLLSMEGARLPRSAEVGLNGRVFLFTGGLAFVTTLLFSLVPGLMAGRDAGSLREGHRGAGQSRGGVRVRQSLVTAEVALCLMLVLGAGLMVRSFMGLVGDPVGIRSEGLLVGHVSLPQSAYGTPEQGLSFFDRLLERLRALPGAQSVTGATHLPAFGFPGFYDFELDGVHEPTPGQPTRNASPALVRPDYFRTLGIPVIKGREFTDADSAQAPLVAVVSRFLVERWMPGEDPIGRRIRMSRMGDPAPWAVIVGMVGDVKYGGMGGEPSPVWYWAHRQAENAWPSQSRQLRIVLKTSGDPEDLAEPLRVAVAEMDPDLAVNGLRPMSAVLAGSVSRPRFLMTVMTVFAAVGLVLGAVGIYGVTSFAVARRTNEIGVRMALGARGLQVGRMVVRQAMTPVALGLALGLTGALAASHLIRSLLFEITPTDPPTYLGVLAVLGAVALAACCLPALRAARIDPIEALRAE